jgi:phenylacetate-CoA ligase
MNILSTFIATRQRSLLDREGVLAHQQRQFRELLQYTFAHSPFYQQLYREHGITERDLDGLTIEDLPVVNKATIMQNFDAVVTDRSLTRASIEEWLDAHQGHRDRMGKYTVLHSSGTSGTLGLYVYNRRAWFTLKAEVMTYIATYQQNLAQMLTKRRLAFYAATHGHFAGVTLATDAPQFLYDVEIFSVLDPFEDICQRMNVYQPRQLSGYASTITQLAQAQIDGEINIDPESTLVGGDPLTPQMREIITQAWPNILVTDYYAASESICIAARRPDEDDYTVFEDLHIVEVLDDAHAPVAVGEKGRVILTNLYNKTLPLIRYDIGDMATRGEVRDSFATLKQLHGRVNDALPITCDDGSKDSIHPIVLSEFFVPGVEKIQFIAETPEQIRLRYVSSRESSAQVTDAFMKLLHQKNATQRTKIILDPVDALPNDPKTGKFRLVVTHR